MNPVGAQMYVEFPLWLRLTAYMPQHLGSHPLVTAVGLYPDGDADPTESEPIPERGGCRDETSVGRKTTRTFPFTQTRRLSPR